MKKAKTIRILNLEDSPLDAEIVQANLLEGGIEHEITRVQTRADFVAALENNSFDLILSDYMLPSFDGLSALEMSQKLRPDVPFIIISGTLGEEAAIELMKNGATDYVLKHRLQRLVPAVLRALGEAEQRRERREAEEALRRSEERFRRLVEQAADAMFTHDLDGRFLDVNRRACESLGYTREELLAMSVADVEMNYAPGALPRLWAQISSGEPRTLEGVHRRKDGTTFPVELRVGMFESEGRWLMLALARDITERKRAEEDLRESEERFRATFEQAAVGLSHTALDGRWLRVNQRLCEIVGYTREELLQQTFQDITHPDDLEADVEHGRQLLAGEIQTYSTEKRYCRKDGSVVWVNLTVSLVREHSGEPSYFIVVIEDITTRKKAEEALRLRDRAIAASSNGIVITDPELPDNPIVYVNPAFELMTGYASEEVVGRNCRFLQGEDRDQPGVGELREAVREGRECRVVLHNYKKDGTPFWNELSVSPVRDERRRLTHFVGVQNDITERKRAEELQRKSEERFRSLVQNASDVVMILDADGTIRYESPAVERMLGFDPEERIGINAFTHMHPDDVEAVKSGWAELLERPGKRLSVNYRLLDREGSWHDIEAIATNLLHDLTIRGIVVNSRDITERKRAEAALKESEERFRLLAEEALEGIILSEKGVLLDANKSALEMMGYELDEAVGKAQTEFVTPEDRELVARKISSESTETYAFRGLKRDGTTFQVEARPRQIPYRGRRVQVTSFLDLTERRRAEEALRQSERLYRTVIEQAAENIFLVDIETKRILEANAALQRSLDYTAEELGRMTLYDIVAHDPESIDRNTRRIVDEGHLSIGERVYRRKDGSQVTVEVNVRTVPYGDRKAMCIVAHDITERKQAEENLRQSLSVLLALREAGQILSSTLESEEIFSRLLDIIYNILNLTGAAVSMRDEEGRIRIRRSVGLEGLWRKARFMPEAEAARCAALENEESHFFSLQRPGSESEYLVGLCTPLRARDRVFGVLEAYGPESMAGSDAMDVLTSLGSQAASALENAQLYGELAEREQRLQELIGRLMGAQEEERRRVAYEVHDGLAQVAVAAHQHLQAFSRRHPPETERSREDLERVLRLVRQTVSDARKIIANLRPTALDDFGLAAAVALEVEGLREDGYRVDYEERLGNERLPGPVEITLFRVAQEALTNIRKHADTWRVHIELWREKEEAHLEVRDYGRGFEPTVEPAGSGPGERVGLAGMRERVGLLGGKIRIDSRSGEGTSVVAVVPSRESISERDEG